MSNQHPNVCLIAQRYVVLIYMNIMIHIFIISDPKYYYSSVFCILLCVASCGEAESDNGGDRESDFDIQGAAATAVSGICV
jgi:hypothetical protein